MMSLRPLLLLPMLLLVNVTCAAGEKTKTVSLTVEQAIALHCVLAAPKGGDRQPLCSNVETYDDVIKEGDRERVVARRYVLKPGVVSAMAKNIVALRSVTDRFERERAVLQEKIFTGGQPDASKPAELAEYAKQTREMLAAKHEFNLYTFSDVDLGIADSVRERDRNAFPASVLAVLDAIRE